MVWTMATFIGFTILVAVISYVKTKDDDQSTADGYFLAGRGLPGFVIAGSLLLTNLSAEQLVGTNGQTWSVGMSPMAFEIVAAPCCIVLALFAAPRYLKSGITTIPELIGLRYDRSTKLWFSIAYIILYLFVQIPVILYSGSLVFENIFNLSGTLGITKFQSIVILCILITIIGSIYAIFGGLKAVAVSDTINGIGLLIGGMLPFVFSALTMDSVSKAAYSMIEEVRRQFRTIPGIMEGTGKPDYKSCVAISTTAALKEMLVPGVMAVLAPLAVGLLLGTGALGGMLAGALVTGVLMAIFMSNSGGAWDNAKKYIEDGNHGGKGSEAHKAAVVGDTVGDPFKDTSGPSINILIKLMTVVSLVFASIFSTSGLL